jgi:predicted nucleic-acid-binding protein
MIGLDTNVLVRYLTHDDPTHYAKAAAFVNAATDRGEQFVVNTAVLCELAWVLGTAYDYSRQDIARALEQIFATAQFDIERLDEARQALGDFRSTKAGFSDALIGRINRALGAEHTVTFDRALKAVETFRLI